MRASSWLTVTFTAVASLFFTAWSAAPARANHIAPLTCGVKSSGFARICRPGAYQSCLRATARSVAGFSKPKCAARQTACRSCLDALYRCIARIGHFTRSEYSCDECSGKFSRCIGKRYPKMGG